MSKEKITISGEKNVYRHKTHTHICISLTKPVFIPIKIFLKNPIQKILKNENKKYSSPSYPSNLCLVLLQQNTKTIQCNVSFILLKIIHRFNTNNHHIFKCL